jgi:Phage terminase, small subunit
VTIARRAFELLTNPLFLLNCLWSVWHIVGSIGLALPIQSPYLSHLNKQAEIMTRIASEFGFTPASRSRIFSYSKSNSMLLEIVEKPDYGLPKW